MNDTERPASQARGWPYVVTGVIFAGICAWVSYNDGLFVARLAGNAGSIAFFYPLLPDGLIVLCLLALAEGARMQPVQRSGWATAGLVLGIGLTLAMNVGAGIAHSVLDAIIDGFVPVVFFIAAEVVLWHVRRGRGNTPAPGSPAASPGTVPSPPFTDAQTAALDALARTTGAGNPLSQNQLMTQFRLSRAEAREVRQKVALREENGNGQGQQDGDPGWQGPRGQAHQDPGRRQQPEEQVTHGRGRDGAFPDMRPGAVPVTMSAPAGEAQVPPPAPAGAQVRAFSNGSGPHG